LKRNEDRFKQKIIDTEKSNKEMGEEIIKLRNELELQRAAMHKTTLTIDTLKEKNISLETKLSLSRAELETVNRRISIEMNESADALNNMRIKNKKLQDSTQDLRSKIKDLQMLVEKQRNELQFHLLSF
jgi:chromosome segregation ATPase